MISSMTKKLTKLPKISIIIPCLNKVDYVKFTLQSIVDQQYPNLEVIIQDGVSTDGTLDIIKKYLINYPEIFYLVSKKDKGQVDAINTGCNKATGGIITFINADDVYSDKALLKVGGYFLNHPETRWLIGFGNIIDDKGRVISTLVTKYKNFLISLNNYQFLLVVNYISQPSVFLSSKAFKQCGPFKGTKKYVMEYYLWIKLARVQMPAVIKDNLSSFRLTMDNISATSYKELLDLDYQIVKEVTGNSVILFFHRLHNLFRVGLISLIKFYEKLLA